MTNHKQLKEVTQIVESLAKRYRNYQEYEDLIQEGFLVALENPQDTLWDLIPKMRRAMSAYATGMRSQVSIPDSGTARSLISAIIKDRVVEPTSHTERALLSALQGLSEPVEANTLRTQESSEDLFSEDELLTRAMECVELYLTKEESAVVDHYYLQEKNLSDVSRSVGLDPRTVTIRRDSALRKLHKMLC